MKSRGLQFLTPALAALFDAPIPKSDAPHAALFHRYAKHHRRRDRDELFRLYCPWVRIIAGRIKAGSPGYASSPPADMIQDGCIGLLRCIDWYKPAPGTLFYMKAWRAIRWAIQEGRRTRQRGGVGAVSLTIDNGNGDTINFEPVDTRERPADAMMMDAEAVRLALAGLKPKDKTIFRMLINGATDVAIAKRIGVSRARAGQITNSLLWEARARSDLAGYFGLEPQQPPAGFNRANPVSPKNFPARLSRRRRASA